MAGWNKIFPDSCFHSLSMTLPGSKVWHSVMPLPLRSKSVTHLRMFPKAKSMDYDPGRTHVFLNVYDLTPVNGYFYWAGLGVFHTGVEGQLTQLILTNHHQSYDLLQTWDWTPICAVKSSNPSYAVWELGIPFCKRIVHFPSLSLLRGWLVSLIESIMLRLLRMASLSCFVSLHIPQNGM